MKLKYNAPATLTFALAATIVLLIDQYIMPGMIEALFTAEGSLTFQFNDIPAYVRMFTHIFGHAGWDHLLSNLTLILLLGPVLEEKYTTKSVAWMIVFTALVNGLVNAFFFESALMGSSGIAFMMILMVSFANIKAGEFPLTALLVVGLYLVKEILAIFRYDDISQVSHIIGAACGAVFGFIRTVGARKKAPGGAPAAGAAGGQTIAN
ncbi:MAG: rhomboid family intramembrane serine protease [Spirochaetaceae bacterium]|nr:rhomboid family intramembrane serine protease [Spirochaetaceae bacterium]RKX72913.1 MAG: rhomboid family intramembrane serine protease [Spirochaetota bacterium]RKX89779.1 MAG: rhomboid family intramembrane serine protease [Spirochaetota bacterium]